MSSDFSDVLTNEAKPKTDATLTIRVIKSFEFRTEKSLVLHHVNLETITVGELKDLVRSAIQSQSGWKPYRNVELGTDQSNTQAKDTLKLYTKAHGAKTTNLIINLDHDEWILDDNATLLASLGLENESEVSFFNRKLYEQFKANPEARNNFLLHLGITLMYSKTRWD